MKTTLKKSLLASTTCLAGAASALIAVTPAFAQGTAPQDAQTSETTEAAPESTIIVTGSLIRNPNLEQANPVNVTTADQIELKQSNTAEEVLRELPGIVPNVGSSTNNGNGGNSYVDLRGLGANRNIVLLDGNRIVPSGLSAAGTSGAVDLNNIPVALVSRVDALTGAAVTTYGADAITGVVNFVTKKDFAGVDFSASEQITDQGDGNYFRTDLTVGANFDDGRGNAVLSVGYQESDPVYQGARDFGAFAVDSFTGTFGGSGTSVPSRFSGTRGLNANGSVSTTAEFMATGATAPNPNFDPTKPASATNPAMVPVLAAVAAGQVNGGVRQVNTAGAAVDTFAFYNFNPFNLFQVPFKRYNVFAQANYEVSDAVEVYTRGLFSKNRVTTIVAPSGSFGGTVDINLNNPFLPATLRNQLCAFNTADPVSGVDAMGNSVSGQVTYTPRLTPAQCAAAATATGPGDPNYQVVTATLNRRAIETGPRIDSYTTTTFDTRVGLRGAINDHIDWDVNGSYGESENIQTRRNYTLQSRFRQASLVNGTAANPVCQDTSNGCVPADIFGGGTAGGISPAAARFLSADSTIQFKTTLAQARAVINGDLGFSSPAASEPIGFAVGTEYRRYGAKQIADFLAQQAGELGGAGGAIPSYTGAYDVYEGYAEFIAPLIEDRAFFKSLTLEAGGRYSHYSVEGGPSHNTTTYKVGASWEPVDGVKFRGNYSHAVRAPNVYELFSPLTVGLTNLAVDPCAGAAPTTNANLRAVCIAQGAPAGTIGSITNPTAGQANINSGGNPNLDPEKANTYTFGIVLQPSMLPRFSISADYYHIRVTDVIGTPTPGDLIGACFATITAASAADPNCTAIRRGPLTGGLDGDAATTPGLFGPLNNLGRLFTDGIDVVAAYNADLGFAKWSVNFTGNYTRNSKFKATPSSANRECVGYYSVNCSFSGSLQPKYQWSLRNTFTIDDIDVSLLWRHIDGFKQEPLSITEGTAAPAYVGDLPASGANNFLNGKTVDFSRTRPVDYFDLTTRFNVTENFTFTFTVQNLFDKQPELTGYDIGSTTFNSGNTYPSTYDTLGRRYAVTGRIRF